MNTFRPTRGLVELLAFAAICLLLQCLMACGTAHVPKISLDRTDEKVFDWQNRPDIVAAVQAADARLKACPTEKKCDWPVHVFEVYEGKTSVCVIYLPDNPNVLGGGFRVFVSKSDLSVLAVIVDA